MRGTGPFRLEELQTGILARYSRNPDWYEDGHPFLDGMEYRFIGEQSVIDTQFEARNSGRAVPTHCPPTFCV